MLQCVKKQTLPFSNKIFRFYFSPCRVFLFSGSSATAELTQQRLRPNCSKFKQATDTGDSHTFSQSPNLVFSSPFENGKWVKKNPSCFKHYSFDFPALSPVVRKPVGAYAQDDAGWRDRWRLPKVRNCQARNLLRSNMELTETKFWIFSIIVAPDTHFGKSVKKVAPISFKFSNCEKVSSGEKWSQHLKPPYDGHFYPMRQR